MLDLQLILREFFSPIDFTMGLITLLFIAVITMFGAQKQDKELRSLYNLNILFKLFFSVVFASYYILILKGGDTYAYWHSTEVLKRIMIDDFDHFLRIINSDNSWDSFRGLFNNRTGYPMRFIFMEPESFFVCKLLLFFNTITLGSYISSTLILAFWMAITNWKLYIEVKKIPHLNQKWLALLFLFIPSVSFWASGVSKDTFALIFIFKIVTHIVRFLSKTNAFKLSNLLWFLVYLYLLNQIRPFLLGAILVPILIMVTIHFLQKLDSFKIIKYIAQAFVVTAFLGLFFFVSQRYLNTEYLSSSSSLNNAIAIQQDFENNKATYGEEEGKRYSLGEIDGSAISLLRSIPTAIIAGILRPFIWEALRPSLLFNGVESIIYLFLLFKFFRRNSRKKIKYILSNQTLTFSLIFIFIIAFMTGFTSILFGVLVRLRAPLLPFLGLLLAIQFPDNKDNLTLEKSDEQT